MGQGGVNQKTKVKREGGLHWEMHSVQLCYHILFHYCYYFTTPFFTLVSPLSQALDFSSLQFVNSPLHTFIYQNRRIQTCQILCHFPKFKVSFHNSVEQNKKEEPHAMKCIRNRSQESRTVCVIFKETQTDSKTAHQRDL